MVLERSLGHAEEEVQRGADVTLLRQIEVSMAQGAATQVACRDAGISLQNYAMSCSTVKSSAV